MTVLLITMLIFCLVLSLTLAGASFTLEDRGALACVLLFLFYSATIFLALGRVVGWW